MAADALGMIGIPAVQSAAPDVAGGALGLGAPGIELHRVQDVGAGLVVDMVAFQAVIQAHVHLVGEQNRIAKIPAGGFFHRAGRKN
jgi:hypothetical protein